MHCLMLLSSRCWVCALSGSVRGRISELMLSKGARIVSPRSPNTGDRADTLRGGNLRSGMRALSLMGRK
jgi:hypothetical protein